MLNYDNACVFLYRKIMPAAEPRRFLPIAVCFACECVALRVATHVNCAGACVRVSHPVRAALHPPLPSFRSHRKQGDYSLATVTLFTPYAATNYQV